MAALEFPGNPPGNPASLPGNPRGISRGILGGQPRCPGNCGGFPEKYGAPLEDLVAHAHSERYRVVVRGSYSILNEWYVFDLLILFAGFGEEGILLNTLCGLKKIVRYPKFARRFKDILPFYYFSAILLTFM